MKKRNPIIEAGEHLDDPELDLYGSGEEDGFDAQAGEFSDEDVVEAVQKTDAATRANIESSRRRGRAPREGRAGHDSKARIDHRAREPVRDREVSWAPADTLYAPKPRPGMQQRWIRVRLGEKDDAMNITRKLSAREGWVPRKIEDIPEDYNVPTIQFGRLGSVIGVSDLVLCERRIEIGMARQRYMQNKLARQMASADKRHLKQVETEDHKFMGGAKEDMAPTVGRGTRRRPEAQQDE